MRKSPRDAQRLALDRKILVQFDPQKAAEWSQMWRNPGIRVEKFEGFIEEIVVQLERGLEMQRMDNAYRTPDRDSDRE